MSEKSAYQQPSPPAPPAPVSPASPPAPPSPASPANPEQIAKSVAKTWQQIRKHQFKVQEEQRKHEQQMAEITSSITDQPDPKAVEKLEAKNLKRIADAQRKMQESMLATKMKLDTDRQLAQQKAQLKVETTAIQQQQAEELRQQQREADEISNAIKEQAKAKLEAEKAQAEQDKAKEKAAAQQERPTTGPEAIAYLLDNLDLDKLEKESRDILKSGNKSKRALAADRLTFINGLRRNEVSPKDLMISAAPVIPPQFRPYIIGDTLNIGDVNALYKDLMEVRDAHHREKAILGNENSGESRLAMYDALRAAYGYGDPVNPKLREKKVSGMMAKLLDKGPKYSFVQRRLLAKPQDSVGRSTIIPDPELGLDEIGIPEEMAWTMYKPYIQRRLVLAGEKPSEAIKQVLDRSDKARKELEAEMRERPVIYSRAPAWHKFNTLGAFPKIRKDNALAINNLVTTGLAGDFDGDSGRFCIKIEINLDELNADVEAQPSMKFNNLNILHYTGPGKGESIRIQDIPHADTPVRTTDNGGSEYKVPKGVYALTYDIDTHVIAWMPVTRFSVHPNTPLYNVTIGDKDCFMASDDHSLIAFNNETCRVEKVKPSEAKSAKGKPFMAPVSWRKNQENNYVTSVNDPLYFEYFHTDLSLTEDFGFALGVYIGDGCFSVDYKRMGREYPLALYLYGGAADSSKRKQTTHMRAIKTFSDAFIINGTIAYNEYVRESLGGIVGKSGRTSMNRGDNAYMDFLYEWIKTHIGTTAEEKHLPSFYHTACEEFRWGLLCGLLASDGTVCLTNGKSKPQLTVAYGTTSPDMATDFQSLCASLGINSTISEDKRKTVTGKTPYIIPVSTISLAWRYQRKPFTLHCDERDALIAEVLPTIRLENTNDRVPFPGGSLGISLKLAYWLHSGKPMNGTKRDWGKASIWASTTRWNRAVAQKYVKILREYLDEQDRVRLDQYVHIVLNPEIIWEEIKVDPEPVTMDAYDLTIPGPYTFATANGTFVQDTLNVHVPHTSSAVRDVKEKLMGSKQLLTIRDPERAMPVLKHEQILGLYNAKNRPSGNVYQFNNREEATQAVLSGKVSLNDSIEIPDVSQGNSFNP